MQKHMKLEGGGAACPPSVFFLIFDDIFYRKFGFLIVIAGSDFIKNCQS
jgi:hypothetical protein